MVLQISCFVFTWSDTLDTIVCFVQTIRCTMTTFFLIDFAMFAILISLYKSLHADIDGSDLMSRIPMTFQNENISTTLWVIVENVHKQINTIIPSRNNFTNKCRTEIILTKMPSWSYLTYNVKFISPFIMLKCIICMQPPYIKFLKYYEKSFAVGSVMIGRNQNTFQNVEVYYFYAAEIC